MATIQIQAKQGDLSLLDDPVARNLLKSTNVGHLAYTWHDGAPRVVPIWFYWNGREIVMGTPPNAPKVFALRENPKVSLEIDSPEWPYKVLIIRGTVEVNLVEGVAPEYAAAAKRYFGEEQGRAWAGQVGSMFSSMARIVLRPEWAGILDFETRFPSAFAAAG